MKPKILVTRKLSDGAEAKLKQDFDFSDILSYKNKLYGIF